MNLIELKSNIEHDIEKGLISSRILLNDFLFIDESSRKTGAYDDPRYMPFYYHLGKYIKPINVLELGFGLGLSSGCLFKSCKSSTNFLGFREKDKGYFSPRLALKNVKRTFKGNAEIYVGGINDDNFSKKIKSKKWDLVLIDEDLTYDVHMHHLDVVWNEMNLDGLIVVDNLESTKAAKRAFADFCKKSNKSPITFNTRYGCAIVEK